MTKNNEIVTLAHKEGYRVDKNGVVMSKTGNVLTPRVRSGYYRVHIRLNGKLCDLFVHRLAAYQKFGDAMLTAECIRHLDGNPLNNSYDNIEIGTRSDNMLDIPEDIRVRNAKYATTCRKNYINDDRVKEIKEFYKQCNSYTVTMNHFGISSKGTLSYILNKR